MRMCEVRFPMADLDFFSFSQTRDKTIKRSLKILYFNKRRYKYVHLPLKLIFWPSLRQWLFLLPSKSGMIPLSRRRSLSFVAIPDIGSMLT